MSDQHTFGPRLRREREKRGISLDALATATKVGADLWEGLERNDLSRWPSGIFARAFVRDYAKVVGLDAEELVDEFCRLFPNGDRRAVRLIKAQAELIGHGTSSLDEAQLLPAGAERRAAVPRPPEYLRLAPRAISAAVDLACVLAIAALLVFLFKTPFWGSAGVTALTYHTICTLTAFSPGARVSTELRHRAPALFAVQGTSRRRAHA